MYSVLNSLASTAEYMYMDQFLTLTHTQGSRLQPWNTYYTYHGGKHNFLLFYIIFLLIITKPVFKVQTGYFFYTFTYPKENCFSECVKFSKCNRGVSEDGVFACVHVYITMKCQTRINGNKVQLKTLAIT
jgi:hypothetical protein